ncbi:hypothetical protein [Allonocardiopsis opalescens]|uniref:Uncharacterized protein n=1 Tax=Allonocardiopsis opalescens TaxID=1144618 RepID=A0A2T0QF24_9ACTN|nr:hypothetical protein [Allonocardiopsis opalescens]PRY02537.1 hypothetical protein CLV72_1011139 [Allonocardiopsis opalescens]
MQTSDYISIAAVMFSLLAAWKAYRVSAKGYETASYHSGTDLFMQLNLVFVEYPQVRPYFYSGKALTEDDPNFHRVQATAELILDVFEWIWHRREGITEVDRQAWSDYIGRMFALSPVLRQYHLNHPAWHPTVTDLYFSQDEFAGTSLPTQSPPSMVPDPVTPDHASFTDPKPEGR